MKAPTVNFRGGRNDIPTKWISLPPLECPCQEILVKFVLRSPCPVQQGKLILRLVRNGSILAEQELASTTAAWTPYDLRLSNNNITTLSNIGDIYEIYRIVGTSSTTILEITGFEIGLGGPAVVAPVTPQQYDVILPVGGNLGTPVRVLTPYYRSVSTLLAHITPSLTT